MFTGIIAAVGHIADKQSHGVDMRLRIATGKLPFADVQLGESIAVSGVCLTVVEYDDASFCADVSGETLARTALGSLAAGAKVNLERSLTLAARLGGHLVSGHVDGLGTVCAFYQDGRSWRLAIEAPSDLTRYIAEKGSVCVDGVSLTVNKIAGRRFDLNIVPHTLQETTINEYKPGRKVNLEVDIIARYLERLLRPENGAGADEAGLSEALLRARGFLRD